MPAISEDDGYPTVLHLFGTGTADAQQRLLGEMRERLDTADHPGLVSAAVLSGVDEPGAACLTRWRESGDSRRRCAPESFREPPTSVKSLRTEVTFNRKHPSVPRVEVTADRDDYTVISAMEVSARNQREVLEGFIDITGWVVSIPGFLSSSLLRSIDGTHVVNYARWSDRESFESFHGIAVADQPARIRALRARLSSLLVSRRVNTYRVVRTRSLDGG